MATARLRYSRGWLLSARSRTAELVLCCARSSAVQAGDNGNPVEASIEKDPPDAGTWPCKRCRYANVTAPAHKTNQHAKSRRVNEVNLAQIHDNDYGFRARNRT
jgi:hypothetical protein